MPTEPVRTAPFGGYAACTVAGQCDPYVERMSMTLQHAIAEPLPERRRLTREDAMTVSEVAELLAMPCSTVYDLARRGELPCARLGRTIRFLRDDIEARLRTG